MPPREKADDRRGFGDLLFGHQGRNRWKGFVLGLIGANLGLILMTYYQTQVAPVVLRRASGDQAQQKAGAKDRGGFLDSISLIGIHHEKGESSTAALGRIGYELLSGREPSEDETRELLSYLVHWVQGMLMGGLYGAARGGIRFPDLTGGLLFALEAVSKPSLVPARRRERSS